MFTKKSLIVSMALILALVCTGIMATSAHTAPPAKKAAPASTDQGTNYDPFGLLNLAQQLNNQVVVSGVPLGKLVPTTVERLYSANLNSLGQMLTSGQPKLKRFITPTPSKRQR